MGKYDHEKMLLMQAAASPYGLVVQSTDIPRDIGALYSALRAESAALPPMRFMRSPWEPQREIWIIKKSAESEPIIPEGEAPPPAITDLTLGDLGL